MIRSYKKINLSKKKKKKKLRLLHNKHNEEKKLCYIILPFLFTLLTDGVQIRELFDSKISQARKSACISISSIHSIFLIKRKKKGKGRKRRETCAKYVIIDL